MSASWRTGVLDRAASERTLLAGALRRARRLGVRADTDDPDLLGMLARSPASTTGTSFFAPPSTWRAIDSAADSTGTSLDPFRRSSPACEAPSGRICCRSLATGRARAAARTVARRLGGMARAVPRRRSDAPDAAAAPLRARRLERSAPRPLRRSRLPVAGRHRSRRSGVDYTGGEFVVVEQRPRAQSRGTVDADRPRAGIGLHHPRPARAVLARLVGGTGAPRGQRASLRPSPDARPRLPRRRVTTTAEGTLVAADRRRRPSPTTAIVPERSAATDGLASTAGLDCRAALAGARPRPLSTKPRLLRRRARRARGRLPAVLPCACRPSMRAGRPSGRIDETRPVSRTVMLNLPDGRPSAAGPEYLRSPSGTPW